MNDGNEKQQADKKNTGNCSQDAPSEESDSVPSKANSAKLTLDLESQVELDADDVTPKAENPDYNWYKNYHSSIDLDEKFSTMTGSYSEILDEDSNDEDKIDEALETQAIALKETHISRVEDDVSPNGPLTVVVPTNQDFFTEGPISAPWYESTSQSLTSLHSAPLSLYSEPPLVDPNVLIDLELHARGIATSMDGLTENLTEILHGISALSVACVETYRDSVCKTCDAVDSNIKSMYQLMAKCEELSKAIKPMYKLQEQIKDIRRLLDMFESAVFSGGT